MTQITRTQLKSLLPVSDCKDWTSAINDLLETTSGYLIDVDQKYIDDLSKRGTFIEVHKVLGLGILDIQYPLEAYNFVRHLLEGCERKGDTYYNSSDQWCFDLYNNGKTNYFLFSYPRVYSILAEKYQCNTLQISKLISTILNDFTPLNLKGYNTLELDEIPTTSQFSSKDEPEDKINLKGHTPFS